MNRYDVLERELTMWFDETAMPRRPDYTADIVEMTAGLPQRRWMTLERWLPMTVIQMRRATAPFPWRTVAVLVALLAILVAGLVYVGSQPRLPPPFGLAGNGLVAYAKDGDILTVDPATGSRRWITAGEDIDSLPRWSPDGTRLAFLRLIGSVAPDIVGDASSRVVVVDADRNVVAESVSIDGIDPDAFAWSPDGRYVAIGARALFLMDAADGALRSVDVAYDGFDVYWRPGHDAELLFRGRTAAGQGLVLADVNRSGSERLIASDADEFLRPNGWTLDGGRFVYTREAGTQDGPVPARIRVLDITTQTGVDIDAGYAHVSNDGMRVVAISDDGRPCIAPIAGGSCSPIASSAQAYVGTHAGGAQWAPNDGSILVSSGGTLALLDPAGGTTRAMPDWMADGAESWQRVAP